MAQLKSRRGARDGWIVTSPVKLGSSFLTIRAQKDEALRHKRAVKAWRVTISDVINVHLERAGVDECLHPDRLEDREIARQPEPKLFPSQSQQYRDNGTVSETMQEVVRVRAERRLTQGHERENAREYWEARKVALGVTETMDLPTRLARVSEARALVRDHAPIHMLAEGYAGGALMWRSELCSDKACEPLGYTV
jgi:hypothetical protein